MAVALMTVTSVQHDVYAENAGMTLTVTAEEGSDIISVNGVTSSNQGDVVFTVKTPDGANLQAIGQETPNSDGEFSTQFNVSNWKQDGMYIITASQGTALLYSITLNVEVNNGSTSETSTSESSLVTNYSNSDVDTVSEESQVTTQGLSISANAMEGSDTIEITGTTTKTNTDVTFTVEAPNGNLVSVDQISPESNGNFELDIAVGGPLWSQDGSYIVTAQQGTGSSFIDSVEVEVADGLVVPEFGTIAAMILAVAIISIIAISAKSRLSIVPRY
jgi:predicted secreted protein with PEFG-CTERM motif